MVNVISSSSNELKVKTQPKINQNTVKPEVQKEKEDKINKKLLLSLGGLAVIASAGLLVRQGRIRKQNAERIKEEIKNLFESINSTKNNINKNIQSIQNEFANAGGRPVHDNWATLGQNQAMDNIENLMGHINGQFDDIAAKYNRLMALISDPVRGRTIQADAIKDKIAKIKLNISIAETTGYKPAWGNWESIGSNDKFSEVEKLKSLLKTLEEKLASLK